MTPAGILNEKVVLLTVNVSKWNPSEQEYHEALALLPADSQERINRFRLKDDAKRCLIGRLLHLYILSVSTLPTDNEESILIETTGLGRPYFASPTSARDIDFNVSHDGNFVVCAVTSGKGCKVGVDVMNLTRQETAEELYEALEDQLSPQEKAILEPTLLSSRRNDAISTAQLKLDLLRLWMYKESLSKMIGLGLSLPFDTITLDISKSPNSSFIRSMATSISNSTEQHKIGNEWFSELRKDGYGIVVCCDFADGLGGFVPDAKELIAEKVVSEVKSFLLSRKDRRITAYEHSLNTE